MKRSRTKKTRRRSRLAQLKADRPFYLAVAAAITLGLVILNAPRAARQLHDSATLTNSAEVILNLAE